MYAFFTPMQSFIRDMERDAPPPPFLADLLLRSSSEVATTVASAELQFFLGPAGSGAPVHFHGHAVNVLAFGAKKWYLHPPPAAHYSKMPAQSFTQARRSAAKQPEGASKSVPPTAAAASSSAEEPLECTQEAGDVLFVPTLWAHGTLNLKQSIGVAYEISVEPFCME